MQYRTFTSWFRLIAVLALAGATGCGKVAPPAFRLDMIKVTENEISPKHQQAIADILAAMFGTPDAPFAMPETGLDGRLLKMAAGPVWSSETGTKHGLYRRHCAHCHGINGDGHGPTAAILNPYPRDYRRGIFKFKGTYTAAEPTDDDLRRVIHNGIPGTAMPAFALLPDDEVESLKEYVKYLSIRGQMETALENYVFDEGIDQNNPLDPAKDAELKDVIMKDLLGPIVETWKAAPEQVVAPAQDAAPPANRPDDQIVASVNAGRELFFGPKANCVKCHGPTGLGDGEQGNYDDWSAANRKFKEDTEKMVSELKSEKEGLAKKTGDERKAAEENITRLGKLLDLRNNLIAHMLEPRHAIPRNLREGSYRGGRRDIDLFWRVFTGIPGMGMPASGPPAPGGQGTLTEQEMWQIVDYIQSLPFEPISEPQMEVEAKHREVVN